MNTRSHHLMNYSSGPPVSKSPPSPQLEKIRRQAVYHLMEYLRTTQVDHPVAEAQTDVPYDLQMYMALQKLLADARKPQPSGASTSLDSPGMLQ